MKEKTMQATSIAFTKTQNNRKKVHLGSCEATANRDDGNASWHVNGHDNLQKIATEASAISLAFARAIEKLKTQYEFYEGQEEDILAVLNRYPLLIADLNRIHDIKCQYFDDAPMSLCYLNETGRLEDASLSAAVVFDDDLWEKKFKSSFREFERECWREMSRESYGFISVGFE